ncbi:MAG TPA: hypothetical protein DHU62_01695 [Firmicutes bacterium]|nr:hypothetical protein [Bacillota bacterium]
MNFYLVDFENVKSEGLIGCETLSESDSIVIFFTKNACKVDMSIIANHGKANLKMIEVPKGKQSADSYIEIYMGIIIGSNSDKDFSITIVSGDKDFDSCIEFFKTNYNYKLARIKQIKENKMVNSAKAKNTIKKEKSKDDFEKEVYTYLTVDCGLNKEKADNVIEVFRKYYGSDILLNKIHNALVNVDSNYEDYYKNIKKILSKAQKKKK